MTEQVEQQIQYEDFLRTVAESLELKLQLPQGRGLVGVVGDGYERSNREALCTWVAANWPYMQQQNAREATEALEPMLVSLLDDLRH